MKTLENYVGCETKSAERKRRQREKEKASKTTMCDNVTEERTMSHRDRDREDSDTDIETDTECKQNPSLQNQPNKKIFGLHKNVYLTDSEYNALAEQYPNEFEAKILHLSNYLYEHPEKERTYNCHYSKIIEWIEGDRSRNQQNLQSKPNQNNMTPQREKEYEDMIAEDERWLLEQAE